ncbi:MAG: ABC transporter substrate-binding protein, partial [Proteobacteria bacterium]|nr:ABC transporter substrate-binding protein [Pseudomonadota bacterium]
MIHSTVSRVLAELTDRRVELESDSALLYALVDEIVVPQIALQKVSRLILGRHWKGANEAQRERFTRSFKDLLIRSYAITMFEYTGKEELRYSPVEL